MMNKADLVAVVNAETGLSKGASEEAVIATTPVIADALARGERVTLVGFRVSQVVGRKTKRGRNLRTGQSMQRSAKRRK